MSRVGAKQRYRGFQIERTWAGYAITEGGAHRVTADSYAAAILWIDERLGTVRQQGPQLTRRTGT